MTDFMKNFFDNAEKYKTIESWESSGLLQNLSFYHKKLLVNYFYKFLKTDRLLINDKISNFYLPCLRRVFEVVVESGTLEHSLKEMNLEEVELDIDDFICYINSNLPKTIIGLSHLENHLDTEAEACSIVANCYKFVVKDTYRNRDLLIKHLSKLERFNKIDSLIGD